MKILLIAYEFPPVLSPQSLRWSYLVRELALCGNDVHVLAPTLDGAACDVLAMLGGVTIHRTFPGPLARLLRSRRSVLASCPSLSPAVTSPNDSFVKPAAAALNWKGRFAERLKLLAGHFMFPDFRAEWNQWAARALRKLVPAIRPDIVVSSHEPANTIALGRLAARSLGARIPWVVDMADPVLATYTPARWARRALEVEERALHDADRVLVTSERAMQLLIRRHHLPSNSKKIQVLTQGFDDRFKPESEPCVGMEKDRLEILYTGNFYAFRRADWLLDALDKVPGVRLTVVSGNTPAMLREWATAHTGKLRIVGQTPHRMVLVLQRHCDVLVNIANDDYVQVPGKFYEYLGADRPIIHLSTDRRDAVSQFLERAGQHSSVVTSVEDLVRCLEFLASEKRGSVCLDSAIPRTESAAFSWSALGRRLHAELRELREAGP